MDVNKNYPYNSKYIIKFLISNKIVVTKEFLNENNVPYIVSILIF